MLQNVCLHLLEHIIIKIIYNQNAGTTSFGNIQVELENSLNKPGSVLLDYLKNERYGCGIPTDRVETTSFYALDDYSDACTVYFADLYVPVEK